MKAMQSEIKKNIQGTNSEGKEIGTQINDLEQNEEIRIFKKVRRGVVSPMCELCTPSSGR